MVDDISSPTHKADPYPFYARLRAETPVCAIKLPDGHTAWLVTRYDDVTAVLKDERFSKDRANSSVPMPWLPPPFRPLTRNMLDRDPPDHTRLRALVQKAFSPRLIERLRERVRSLSEELLGKSRGQGAMDLIRDYALPIPTTIIAELLGVPPSDRHRFQRWSRTLLTVSPTGTGVFRALPDVWAFMNYVRSLVRRRRREPRDDLATELVEAQDGGERLTEDELLAMVVLLLVAGHETTVNLIGNGTLALLRNPGELRRLREDPSLVRPAVEELLRYESPVETATERFAREDVEIAGVRIPRGALVYAVLASANRDERQFPDPDLLDITRDPNRHVAFGLGPHFCLGAALARLEGQIAIETLVREAPGLRLGAPPEALRWRSGLLLRGLEALPVAFGSAGGR